MFNICIKLLYVIDNQLLLKFYPTNNLKIDIFFVRYKAFCTFSEI